MIESTNSLSEKTEYTVKCDKYGTTQVREVKKDPSMPLGISNIDTAFNDKAKVEFLKWLDDNNFKNECWCKHIKDFV